MIDIRLHLFIAGTSARSERAVQDLERICAAAFEMRYEIEVIDVVREPDRAEADRILTTPTVLKVRPEPKRRIIGDLRDQEKVLRALGLMDERGVSS